MFFFYFYFFFIFGEEEGGVRGASLSAPRQDAAAAAFSLTVN